MNIETIRKRLYEVYPDLVFRYGMSHKEATAYGLLRVMGMTREDAAEAMTELIGRQVSPRLVSDYDNRAKHRIGQAYMER